MSIIHNLRKTQVAVYVDNFKGGDLGRRIGKAAVEAIMNGIGKPEWEKYMALFCDTKEELERLTVPKPSDEENYMPQMRAYIVANAVCAADTNTFTANRVTPDFGFGLSDTADAVPGEFRDAAVFDKITNAKLT